MRSMGRDEPLMNFLLQMAFRLFANLTVGIAGGVLHFFWVVVGIVRSFQPSIPAALLFLALALLAGISFFVSAVLALNRYYESRKRCQKEGSGLMLSLRISLDSAQVINLAQTVERLLQESKIGPLDKLRLIVLYIGARAA